MQYTKVPLSIADQITRLTGRGLIINDVPFAESKLNNISFYRLRAYTYPFQNNSDPNHLFIKEVSFEEIISFYEFDRDLRLLVFDAIERIEIALRTRIVYYYALTHGSHWFENKNIYRNRNYFNNDISSLDKEIDRSDEEFIKHYKSTYSSPIRPPAWMSLEVATLTTLSKMFQNLSRSPEKKKIAKSLSLDFLILENWMHVLSNVRNICAHHSRLYNRTLSQSLILPANTFGNSWIKNRAVDNAKMYAVMCAIVYLLDRINGIHDFRSRLISLFAKYPIVHPRLLNFPANWDSEIFWR
ncbi:MAG: Abi family protein [Bacteroidetes bacterium]|nr:Abi family protein [Bacteroidota bacterium]